MGMHVSKRLLQWRLRQAPSLSQAKAAAAAGVTQSSWQKYENGLARPKPRGAQGIEALTESEIRIADWAETDEEVAMRKARALAHSAPRIAKAS